MTSIYTTPDDFFSTQRPVFFNCLLDENDSRNFFIFSYIHELTILNWAQTEKKNSKNATSFTLPHPVYFLLRPTWSWAAFIHLRFPSNLTSFIFNYSNMSTSSASSRKLWTYWTWQWMLKAQVSRVNGIFFGLCGGKLIGRKGGGWGILRGKFFRGWYFSKVKISFGENSQWGSSLWVKAPLGGEWSTPWVGHVQGEFIGRCEFSGGIYFCERVEKFSMRNLHEQEFVYTIWSFLSEIADLRTS